LINFIIAARRKREDTQERYFYEWGIIHVALMISTPQVMQLFKRYVQHYSVSGVTSDMLIHPLSDMEWDNMAEHWIDSLDDFVASTRVADYVARMQPHKFGDPNFVLMLAQGETVFEESGFTGGRGGVKLVHFLKRKPGLTQEQFNTAWRERHARTVSRLNRDRPLIRRYVQDRKLEVPAGNFNGSLFAQGDAQAHSGVEEFWFRSLEDLAQLRRDPAWRDAWLASEAEFVDPDGSFSMVATERVVYDYTLGDRSSPKAAVLDPHSLEAAVFAQGLGGWNIPKPV
jgi:EthD domain-containing protein